MLKLNYIKVDRGICMKINFTRKQFEALMDLMRLNLQLINESESKEYKEYSSLIQYILSYEDLHNALSDNDYEEETASSYNKEEGAMSLKEEYDESAFWRELCKRLAASKLFEEGFEINCDNYEEYEHKKRSLELIYFKKFKAMEYNIDLERKGIK